MWIRNSKGEYLLSQRSANRPAYPLMWECVGGSVVKGEDSLLGAIRETKEEVDLSNATTIEDFDYDEFFQAAAKGWALIYTENKTISLHNRILM